MRIEKYYYDVYINIVQITRYISELFLHWTLQEIFSPTVTKDSYIDQSKTYNLHIMI